MAKELPPTLSNLWADTGRLWQELQAEPDRGAAIVGAAFLDDALEAMLRAFLVDEQKVVDDLLRPEGDLGKFSTRIKVAYCLGLVAPDERHDMNLIGKIRNRFAHVHQTLSFDHSEIAGWCRSLRRPAEHLAATEGLAFQRPRDWFVFAVVVLTGTLLHRARHNVKHATVAQEYQVLKSRPVNDTDSRPY
jgi:hypothetical protein